MHTYTDTCMGVEIMFMDEYDSLTDQNIKRVCDLALSINKQEHGNEFVIKNYEKIKERAENGIGFVQFLKSIFGKRMG